MYRPTQSRGGGGGGSGGMLSQDIFVICIGGGRLLRRGGTQQNRLPFEFGAQEKIAFWGTRSDLYTEHLLRDFFPFVDTWTVLY